MDVTLELPLDRAEIFETGEPCKNGHTAPRYKSNRMCVECLREKAKKRQPELQAAQKERYATDEVYRAAVNARNNASYQKHKKKRQALHKQRMALNPEYREKVKKRRAGYDKNDKLKRTYGITLDAYNAMLDSQHGVCAICKQKEEKALAVDHCHTTDRIRGLLCSKCNRALGYFADDISRLQAAITYLEQNDGD